MVMITLPLGTTLWRPSLLGAALCLASFHTRVGVAGRFFRMARCYGFMDTWPADKCCHAYTGVCVVILLLLLVLATVAAKTLCCTAFD
jgi:hypothetical protein